MTQSANWPKFWLSKKGGRITMTKIYYNRIKAGIMTIDDVPARWRAAVQAMLDEDEQE